MTSEQLAKVSAILQETSKKLDDARATIAAAETLLQPLVAEETLPALPQDVACEIVEMWDHVGEAQSMLDYAGHDRQRVEKAIARVSQGGGQASVALTRRNGSGKVRVRIVGGVSDDDKEEEVYL